jgi:hypothetical protein
MHIPADSGAVNDHLRRHAPQLEQVNFLPEEFQHAVVGVWKPDKWQVVLPKIGLKCRGSFRADDDHFGLVFLKLCIVLAQLRHVLLAKRSGKASIENQQDILLAPEIFQPDGLALKIRQREFGGGGVDRDA